MASASALATGDVLAGDRELAALQLASLLPLVRHVFTASASWALFHADWMDCCAALVRQFGCSKVLEVCAGGGLLLEPMRRRGLEWRACDAKPPRNAHAEVAACSALEAVRAQPPDSSHEPSVCFWSWWSTIKGSSDHAGGEAHQSAPEDVLVVQACLARGQPVIFVGEPRGGLTGSCELWDATSWTIRAAADVWRELVPSGGDTASAGAPTTAFPFADVVQWAGFSDRTWVILPSQDNREAGGAV